MSQSSVMTLHRILRITLRCSIVLYVLRVLAQMCMSIGLEIDLVISDDKVL